MKDRKKNFIIKSCKKFGNKYNYDKFVYTNNLTKSTVNCPIHGDFEVTPATHLSNSKYGGCHKCLKEKRYYKYYNDCKICAFKYETRGEFQKKDKNKYNIAYRHGWLDEICSHMKKIGNSYYRCVYVYEFEQFKSVYVGLTYDIDNRDLQHKNKNYSSVREFSLINNTNIPKIKQLTEYIDKDKASELEGFYLEKYKNDGWLILNKNKTGGLGGNNRNTTFTKEMCFEIAKKYNKVSDCEKENFKVCQILRKNGWVKEAFPNVFNKFKIVCFNLNGDFIKIYDNPKTALIDLNLNITGISNCINNKARFTGNYQFIKWVEWVKLGKPNKIRSVDKSRSNYAEVVQLTLGGVFLNEFKTISEAIKFLNKNENSRSSITKCCNGKLKTAYGFIWMYKSDYKLK